MERKNITFALAKGRLLNQSVALLLEAGLLSHPPEEDRRLTFEDTRTGIRYLICRAADVPTYVEYGAADLGVSGKDVLMEQDRDVAELLDLGFGPCRFVVAVPASRAGDFQGGLAGYLSRHGRLRVATKFPRVAQDYLRRQGLPAEIIKLSGNIELAPLVGLAEVIIDLVSTGRTLRENNLVPVEEIAGATARLIANRVACCLHHQRLAAITAAIKRVLERGLSKCSG